MRADVFDHVRPQRVFVTAFDGRWEICLNSAYDWIGAVGFDPDTLAGIFPGSISDGDVEAMYQLQAGMSDAADRWANAARVALGKGSGRDWWWSLNLIKRALSGWPYIHGRLLLAGVNARTMPLPDWLDSTYMLLWQGCDEQGRMKLDLELSLPPAGVAIRRSKQATRKMLEEFAAD